MFEWLDRLVTDDHCDRPEHSHVQQKADRRVRFSLCPIVTRYADMIQTMAETLSIHVPCFGDERGTVRKNARDYIDRDDEDIDTKDFRVHLHLFPTPLRGGVMMIVHVPSLGVVQAVSVLAYATAGVRRPNSAIV